LVGGFNVYPRVVEEVFYQHPAVHEVTVIGIPDDYLGERPKAFVTLKNPDDSLTEDELMVFVRERLGKHERPKEIEFRAELPKTMVGKLSKKELVAEEKAKYEQRKAN
ncbi:MAG: long-chain fatty acid--CoA ligase, partial [Alphaproteobacteria bacterium]|nr:long-chain fatty acid--CoA ligase [Alphaproteobacteria bacterium]